MDTIDLIAPQFAILDHIPTGAFVLRSDFVVVFWNSRLEEWTGIARRQIIGMPVGEYFPHLKTPKYASRIQDVFHSGMPFIFSSYLHKSIIPVTLPDQQLQIQSLTVTRVPDVSGAAWYVLFSIQDVTELTHRIRDYRLLRDQAQKEVNERKQAEARRQESEDRLRRVVENMPVLMIAFDAQYHISVWNRECERVTGYSAAEIIGNPRALALLFPDLTYRQWVIREWIRQTDDFYNVEVEMISQDQTPKIVACSNPSGQFPIPGWRMWAIGVDVTKRKQAEEAIQHAKLAAEEANRAKSAFLANMSHELRTPLNAILGFTQLMSRSPTIEPEQRDNLAIIQRSGEHLLALINQVLDLSKIEAGKMTLNETTVNAPDMLHEVIDLFRLRAQEKGLQLVLDYAADAPRYIRIDEVKLRQVLINLLQNAIKFTKVGQISVRVAEGRAVNPVTPQPFRPSDSQTFRRSDSQPLKPIKIVQFEVEDTGPGIAPEEVAQLFEPFVQTTTGRKAQEGTGLGLPISQKFVRLLGGELQVDSVVGRGTTLRFAIPVTLAAAEEVTSIAPARRVRDIEPGHPAYRILIVDDTWESRQLLQALLQPLGFELREAANGQDAIAIWQAWRPHLIWMDMRMPGLDGYEATRRIRGLETGRAPDGPAPGDGQNDWSRTVIIAATASSFEEERAVILAAGCDDFLRKPFKDAEIFELMQKYLGVRYVYAEPELPPQAGAGTALRMLTPEMLTNLPPNLLAHLEHATLTTDLARIAELVTQIRPQQSDVADLLAQLADHFEYATIMTCLQEVKTLKKGIVNN